MTQNKKQEKRSRRQENPEAKSKGTGVLLHLFVRNGGPGISTKDGKKRGSLPVVHKYNPDYSGSYNLFPVIT